MFHTATNSAVYRPQWQPDPPRAAFTADASVPLAALPRVLYAPFYEAWLLGQPWIRTAWRDFTPDTPVFLVVPAKSPYWPFYVGWVLGAEWRAAPRLIAVEAPAPTPFTPHVPPAVYWPFFVPGEEAEHWVVLPGFTADASVPPTAAPSRFRLDQFPESFSLGPQWLFLSRRAVLPQTPSIVSPVHPAAPRVLYEGFYEDWVLGQEWIRRAIPVFTPGIPSIPPTVPPRIVYAAFYDPWRLDPQWLQLFQKFTRDLSVPPRKAPERFRLDQFLEEWVLGAPWQWFIESRESAIFFIPVSPIGDVIVAATVSLTPARLAKMLMPRRSTRKM